MDVVGSEIGQKMRSAIKAKLTELGCYVDDELPDYVMVMVANKRTSTQMEEDLQLFLGDNTDLFVNWLHQVLKKLQEVTVTAPLKAIEGEKNKERSQSKEKKAKEKKDKDKKNDSGKKAKKKEKEKEHKRKEKKTHKSKKSMYHKMIRPNVPPLLMNIEKNSEPSITDVFAGQILKNHGINLDDDKKKEMYIEEKHVVNEPKRPLRPVIDPATISQPESVLKHISVTNSTTDVKEKQMQEMHEIEAKRSAESIKQKSINQLDLMSDDEDFLNIRTEADELMNDFAEDSFQEVSQTTPTATPPLLQESPTPSPQLLQTTDLPKDPPKETVENLPTIELNLPKRPIRERLGVREFFKKAEETQDKDKIMATKPASPERFTPEREPEVPVKSARSRLGVTPEQPHSSSLSDKPPEKNETSKKLNSKVSVLEKPAISSTCASVVRVRPRPRVSAPASNLLLKAVADAHKSLLNAPPKIETDQHKQKRALVLPMQRSIEGQKIVIQVPRDSDIIGTLRNDNNDKNIKLARVGANKKDFAPTYIANIINNADYVANREITLDDDTSIMDNINIHSPAVEKQTNTQFIVTMDGYLPNAFLAKKLEMEGLDDEVLSNSNIKPTISVLRTNNIEEHTKEKEVKKLLVQEKLPPKPTNNNNQTSQIRVSGEQIKEVSHTIGKESKLLGDANHIEKKLVSDTNNIDKKQLSDTSNIQKKQLSDTNDKQKKRLNDIQKKRLSNTSEESDTQVIIKQDFQSGEKRKGNDVDVKSVNSETQAETPPVKKRKASPIVFDIDKTDKETEKRVRERTQSASSDIRVTVSTITSSRKYDSALPLSLAERKLTWCRSFPQCRYGNACAFAHPRCRFATNCMRRGCVFSHALTAAAAPTAPTAQASHIAPGVNYKTTTTGNICKFYPNCVNPACHFYHPKPCRYNKTCANKLECNFYHDIPSDKWKYYA